MAAFYTVYGDWPSSPTDTTYTSVGNIYSQSTPKPAKSIYIRRYIKYPWPKSTPIIHRDKILVHKPEKGFIKQIFHPPE